MKKLFIFTFLIYFSSYVYSQCDEKCESGNCTTGFGVYRFKSCEWYEGNWSNGKRSGFGIDNFKNGEKYVGDWQYDKRNGYGANYYANGKTKIGYWKDNIFLGNEKPNGSSQNSNFYMDPNGCPEKCESGNCSNGFGVYIYSSCDKYEGYWSDDKRSGYGTYYINNGVKYEGEWLNNIPNGYGINYFTDGTAKTGYWKDDIYRGTENAYSH